MSPPRGGDSWKWSETENQSKPRASANFHSLRISPSGPPMWPMWIPNFMSLSRADGACWHHPFAGLARDPGDQIETCVVVKDGKAAVLCRRGNQEVRDLPPPKAAGSKQTLHLASP